MDKLKAAAFNKIINQLGLVSIGAFCFLYSMYVSRFAETHITIRSLNLPLFVGEMLLAWCIILLFCKWWINGFPWNRWILGLGLYCGWIFIKAFGPGGYGGGYGALSFRNAALFYYLLFGVLGYSFYDREFFSPVINFMLILLLGTTLHLQMVHDYYWLTYVLLFTLLAFKMPQRWLTYLILAVGLFAFAWKTLLFGSSRSHLMGVCIVFIFFFVCLAFVFLPFRLRDKWLSLVGLMVVFCLGIFGFADPNAVKSLTTPARLIKQFKELDTFVKRYENKFVLRKTPVNLYNADKVSVESVQNGSLVPHWGQERKMLEDKPGSAATKAFSSNQEAADLKKSSSVQGTLDAQKEKIRQPTVEVQMTRTDTTPEAMVTQKQAVAPSTSSSPIVVEKPEAVATPQTTPETASAPTPNADQNPSEQEERNLANEKLSETLVLSQKFVTEDDIQSRPELFNEVEKILQQTSSDGLPDDTKYRSLGIAYGNIHFRLFIWRDMLRELWPPQYLLNGVGFGKPQRSRSIEIIGWGKLEWKKTGWITPHNSYLHMIYRAGIVGILIVIFIFVVLIKMIRVFMQYKSLAGSLLVMCLIYWIVFAFFSVFLEVPYTAIPFWTLFGMTLAYAHQQVKTLEKGAAA